MGRRRELKAFFVSLFKEVPLADVALSFPPIRYSLIGGFNPNPGKALLNPDAGLQLGCDLQEDLLVPASLELQPF